MTRHYKTPNKTPNEGGHPTGWFLIKFILTIVATSTGLFQLYILIHSEKDQAPIVLYVDENNLPEIMGLHQKMPINKIENESEPIESSHIDNKNNFIKNYKDIKVETTCKSVRTSAGYLCHCETPNDIPCKNKVVKMPEAYESRFWHWHYKNEDVQSTHCQIKLKDGLVAEGLSDDKNTNWIMLDDSYLIDQKKALEISRDEDIWLYVNTQNEYHSDNIPLGSNYILGACDE